MRSIGVSFQCRFQITPVIWYPAQRLTT